MKARYLVLLLLGSALFLVALHRLPAIPSYASDQHSVLVTAATSVIIIQSTSNPRDHRGTPQPTPQSQPKPGGWISDTNVRVAIIGGIFTIIAALIGAFAIRRRG